MGNSAEHFSHNCILFSYSQGRAESGALLPLFFQKGGKRAGANFSSQYHRELHGWQDLVRTNLLQLFTHAQPQHSVWFSTLSAIIFEVNMVAEQKQTYWWIIFVFYKFAFPSILLLTLALPLLRLLPVFYVISPINWASSQTWLSTFRSQNC